ncbi:MAG TPA: hypothetical protein DDW30_01020 [Clostridiales bacterium]|nr:hypothetical protein [Clostridiales bacterium]
MSRIWNPWHGCHRVSEGCRNCYVFRIDGGHGQDTEEVRINSDFLLPLKHGRDGAWKIEAGETLYTCFTSDFLLPDADAWRPDVWQMMRVRQDLHFVIFTKRIERLPEVLPADWGDGYPNVTFGCTCENRDRAAFRLPIFLKLPIHERIIVCEPLLEAVDLRPYLKPELVREVTVGGESGEHARLCDFEWVRDISRACREAGVRFRYHQTGARLLRDGTEYRIPRGKQQTQAQRAERLLLSERE